MKPTATTITITREIKCGKKTCGECIYGDWDFSYETIDIGCRLFHKKIIPIGGPNKSQWLPRLPECIAAEKI